LDGDGYEIGRGFGGLMRVLAGEAEEVYGQSTVV
jgi:hypothetical protein